MEYYVSIANEYHKDQIVAQKKPVRYQVKKSGTNWYSCIYVKDYIEK